MTEPFDFSCGVHGDPNRFLKGEPRIVFLDDAADLEVQLYDLVDVMTPWLPEEELDTAITDLTRDGVATLTIPACSDDGSDLIATLRRAYPVDDRQLCFDWGTAI